MLTVSNVQLTIESATRKLFSIEVSFKRNCRVALAIESIYDLVVINADLGQIVSVSHNVDWSVKVTASTIEFNIQAESHCVGLHTCGFIFRNWSDVKQTELNDINFAANIFRNSVNISNECGGWFHCVNCVECYLGILSFICTNCDWEVKETVQCFLDIIFIKTHHERSFVVLRWKDLHIGSLVDAGIVAVKS